MSDFVTRSIAGRQYECFNSSIPSAVSLSGFTHSVKNTTRKPTQLPTTPMAEYELVNINGKNSYFTPNTI